MTNRSQIHPSLLVRDLPKLQVKTTSTSTLIPRSTTSTAQDATAFTSYTGSSTDSINLSYVFSISDISSKTIISSEATSMTTSVVASTIKPPTADNNPFIYKSGNLPDGTVFIAVGAIAGFIFVCLIIWWSITKYLSQRYSKLTSKYYNNHNDNLVFKEWKPKSNAKNSRILSDSSSMGTEKSSNYYYDLEEKHLSKNKSTHNVINGNNEKINTNEMKLDNPFSLRASFDPIQNDSIGYPNNKRNSLFISPTLQITQHQTGSNTTDTSMINMQKNTDRNSVLSLISNKDEYDSTNDNDEIDNLKKPERLASPERQKKLRERSYKRDSPHKRNGSQLNFYSSPSRMNLNNNSPPSKITNSIPNYNKNYHDGNDYIKSNENSNSASSTPQNNPTNYLNNLLDGLEE